MLRAARLLAGGGILAFLIWRLGTGPFLGGLRVIDGWVLLAAVGIGVVSTVACACRWSLVARGLGVRLPVGAAVAAYYRSQFLNTVLPGGVLGDVHRAVRHGRDVGDVGRGIRAVVLERTAGQVVQIVIAVVVLVALPSPVRGYLPAVTAVLAAGALGAVVLAWFFARRARRRPPRVGWRRTRRATPAEVPGMSRRARALRTAASDLYGGLFAGRNAPGIALASTVAVACHVATFVIAASLVAARSGAAASARPVSLALLVPLALLVLLAMGLPLNIGGWGPREGAAAWAFGAAGLSATMGVSTAVVYGVLAFAAGLPGAGVLVAQWTGRRIGRRERVAHG
ncbi:lysylphosphatidylglycerol synthase transmembrane domain-containing protein [Rugosimonospora acidiphila]|uniref:lysylphosphatidylglycerol synthase transmembrane domain-containing protein n=1 Tax=Rugosimonospora acidiphila TaxID=556531 RepID=UPI0031E7CDC0